MGPPNQTLNLTRYRRAAAAVEIVVLLPGGNGQVSLVVISL